MHISSPFSLINSSETLETTTLLFSVNAGTNKQHAPTRNTAKLDRETEELKHKSIDNSVARIIQQGRQAKGLSQKDLATKINEKPQIVNDYEAGRWVNESVIEGEFPNLWNYSRSGIPNNIILGKMERVIGVKLRGKDIGQPIAPPTEKK